jgi:hypothetical protein
MKALIKLNCGDIPYSGVLIAPNYFVAPKINEVSSFTIGPQTYTTEEIIKTICPASEEVMICEIAPTLQNYLLIDNYVELFDNCVSIGYTDNSKHIERSKTF